MLKALQKLFGSSAQTIEQGTPRGPTNTKQLSKSDLQSGIKAARQALANGELDAAKAHLAPLPSETSFGPDVYLLKAQLADAEGDRPKQLSMLQNAAAQYPTRIEVLRARIRAFESKGQLSDAIAVAREFTENAADSEEAWVSLARLQKKAGSVSDAEGSLQAGLKSAQGWKIPVALAQLQISAGRPNDALKAARIAENVAPTKPAVVAVLAKAMFHQTGGTDPLRILETGLQHHPKDTTLLKELANLQVLSGDDLAARKTIAALGRDMPDDREVVRLRIWAQSTQRSPERARALWQKHELASLSPALVGDISKLTHLSGALDPKTSLLRLSLLHRNSLLRLPFFLEYYRDLGVERFVIVDNASTDGSIEYLKDQPDVCLYVTEASFAAAHSGIRWINGLMDLCSDEHWWVHADVDEFLVLPGDAASLKDHIARFEASGEEILPAYMLDMFPEREKEGQSYTSGMNPQEVSPWFDNTYRFFGSIAAPYLDVDGGVRNRVAAKGAESRPLLTKTAMTRRARYVNSHCTTPARPTKTHATFLHYKFIGPYRAQIKSEIVRKEHYHGAAQYALLDKGLEALQERETWVGPESHKLTDRRELERLGLIGFNRPNLGTDLAAGFQD